MISAYNAKILIQTLVKLLNLGGGIKLLNLAYSRTFHMKSYLRQTCDGNATEKKCVAFFLCLKGALAHLHRLRKFLVNLEVITNLKELHSK